MKNTLFDLTARTALITGGNKGIGNAMRLTRALVPGMKERGRGSIS